MPLHARMNNCTSVSGDVGPAKRRMAGAARRIGTVQNAAVYGEVIGNMHRELTVRAAETRQEPRHLRVVVDRDCTFDPHSPSPHTFDALVLPSTRLRRA